MNDLSSKFERVNEMKEEKANNSIEWGWAVVGYALMALAIVVSTFVAN